MFKHLGFFLQELCICTLENYQDIYFPGAYLEFPNMLENLPRWTMFAAQGFAIAHELGHALTGALELFAEQERSKGLNVEQTYYYSVVKVRNITSLHGVFRSRVDARRPMSPDSLTKRLPARS